jgi:quercetin dioxygenase-like cupin family protein
MGQFRDGTSAVISEGNMVMSSFGRWAIHGALTFALTVSVTSVGSALELDQSAVTFKLPEQIEWKDPLGVSGAKTAVLFGDPSKPGLYVMLIKWLPGNFSRPHFHPNDRFFMVVKGTWWVGTGRKFDPNTTVAMRVGTFVTHHAKQVHWDGAKDEETIIFLSGEGPATTTRVEEEK